MLLDLAAEGITVQPDYSFYRVLDGFSAALDARAVSLLDRNPEVTGVYPVRAAFPASVSETLLASKPSTRRAVIAPRPSCPGTTEGA